MDDVESDVSTGISPKYRQTPTLEHPHRSLRSERLRQHKILGCAAFLAILRPLWKKWLGPIFGSAVGGRLQKYLQAHRISHAPERIILYYAEESDTDAVEFLPGPDSEVHLTSTDIERAREVGRAVLSPLVRKQAFLRFYCSPYWRAKEALSALLEGVETGLYADNVGAPACKKANGPLMPGDSLLRRFWQRMQLQAEQEAEPQGVPDSACRAEGHFLADLTPSRRTPVPHGNEEICLISDPKIHLECFNYWKKVYDIQEDLRLRDQELGFGRARTERVRAFLMKNLQANMHHRFSGAESGATVYDRLLTFKAQLFEDLNSRPKVDCCVLVAHKTVIRILLPLLSPSCTASERFCEHPNANLVVLVKDPCCGEYSFEDKWVGYCTGEPREASAAEQPVTFLSSSAFQDCSATPGKSLIHYFEGGKSASQVETSSATKKETPLCNLNGSLGNPSKATTGRHTQYPASRPESSKPPVPAVENTPLPSRLAAGPPASALKLKNVTAPTTGASPCSSAVATPQLGEHFTRPSSSSKALTPARQLNFQQQRRPGSGIPQGIPGCKPPQRAASVTSAPNRASHLSAAASAFRETLSLGSDVQQQNEDCVCGLTRLQPAVSLESAAVNCLPARESCFLEVNTLQCAGAGGVSPESTAGVSATCVAASRERSPRLAAVCQNLPPVPRLSAAAEQVINREPTAHHISRLCDAGGHAREESLRRSERTQEPVGLLSSRTSSEAALQRGRPPEQGRTSQQPLQDCNYYSTSNTPGFQLRRHVPPKQPVVAAFDRGDSCDARNDHRSRSLPMTCVPRPRRSLSGPKAVQTLSGVARRKELEEKSSSLTPRRCLHEARDRSPSLDLTTQPSPGIFFSKVVESAKKYEAMNSRSTSPSAAKPHEDKR